MSNKAGKRARKRGKKRERAQAQSSAAEPVVAIVASEQSNAALVLAPIEPAHRPTNDPEVEIDLTSELASLVPEPLPSEPAPRMRSGIAPRIPETPRIDDETLSEALVSLRPLYRDVDTKKSERASELKLEDLSLRFDNPYAASPLTPPPEPPLPKRTVAVRFATVAGLVLVAASSSYGLWRAAQSMGSNRELDVAQAKAAEALPSPPEVTAASAQLAIDSVAAAPDTTGSGAPEANVVAPGAAPLDLAVEAAAASAQASGDETPVTNAPPAKTLRGRRLRGALRAPAGATGAAVAKPAAGLATAQAAAAAALPSASDLALPIAATTAPDPNVAAELPKLPSPKSVRAAFDQIHTRLSTCVAGRHGVVTLRVTLEGSGRVAFGSVEGLFQGAEERDCLSKSLSSLVFPQFKQNTFKIAYPMAL